MSISPTRVEPLILRELFRNEEFMRKVSPFLKPDYFDDKAERLVYEAASKHIQEYNHAPSTEVIRLNFSQRGMDGKEFADCMEVVGELENEIPKAEPVQLKWMLDTTEKWCKDQAIANAVLKAVEILEEKSGKDRGHIPGMLSEALAISFDNKIGHRYFDEASDRYDSYHLKESKMPFNIGNFNRVTDGGVPSKTLNIVMAGTGVGKSLFLCHHSAHCLKMGKNVLYITLELSEKAVGERIDENLLRMTREDLRGMEKEQYLAELAKMQEQYKSHLVIREFPTSSAHVGHFRALLNELLLKQKFKPDVIMIDYLNICASQRYKSIESSYSYVKAIAEEVRGLAVEFDVPIFSATQVNRGGFNDVDIDLTDTSESFGLPFTADFFFALIETEEYKTMKKLKVKVLKNRYGTLGNPFIIGVDKARMMLFEAEDEAQADIHNSDVSIAKYEQKKATLRMNPEDAETDSEKKFQARFSRGMQIMSQLTGGKDDMKW
jgi:replicative DNA helicase